MVSEFAVVPSMIPAVELLEAIITLCTNIVSNRWASNGSWNYIALTILRRYSASMLCDRCCDLLRSFKNASDNMSPGQIDNAMHEIQRYNFIFLVSKLMDWQICSTLVAMEKKMSIWNAKGSLQLFLDHKSIGADIEKCHKSIDGCLSKFQVYLSIVENPEADVLLTLGSLPFYALSMATWLENQCHWRSLCDHTLSLRIVEH